MRLSDFQPDSALTQPPQEAANAIFLALISWSSKEGALGTVLRGTMCSWLPNCYQLGVSERPEDLREAGCTSLWSSLWNLCKEGNLAASGSHR